MKKSLITLFALFMALAFGSAFAMKHEKPNDAVMAACKDKKPGTEVMVGDKKMKCPAAKKKVEKKDEMKKDEKK